MLTKKGGGGWKAKKIFLFPFFPFFSLSPNNKKPFMRARSKTNKVLDIALSEEKFCFPGETIQGNE